jgi:hypothetical protein
MAQSTALLILPARERTGGKTDALQGTALLLQQSPPRRRGTDRRRDRPPSALAADKSVRKK